ncbi:MAG: hypothetical protein PF572_02985 [Patescibacteria group bacterium]|jgi:hypothetical protein|nr:hypothetical protein [Patescibacteria group bacterium]
MKKISLALSVFLVVIIVAVYFVFWPKARFELAKEVVAGGGFPTQVGLTGIATIDCFLSCPTPSGPTCCAGGTLCTVKTPELPSCPLYSDVSGAPSGGTASNILLTKSNMAAAGVASGGQLIAAGNTPTQMDQGPLAGQGGCVGAGCITINNKNIFQKYYEIIKYGIASFKD